MEEDNTIYDITEPRYVEDANASIIKVIGVGGGGGNAVNYMYRQEIPNVNFVVCNTDQQHLNMSPVPNKLLLGWEITHGRGAGNNPEVGSKCAEASATEISKLFDDRTEMVFITAGMGGGTGTGAAPVVARLAKEAGMLTIGIVTVPFMFEGQKKIVKALDGADLMREHVDALLLINNENLIELYPDLNFFNAFEKADDTLANAARSISEIITDKGYVNVDFEDVKTTLKDSGTAIISTAFGEGEHRISDAIRNALHSPLLKKHDINTSKRLLFKFTFSKDSENALRTEEIAEVTEFVSKLPANIDVKWGFCEDSSLGAKVKVTVLASGFDVTLREGSSKSKKDKKEDIVFKADPSPAEEKQKQEETSERIAEIYGSDRVKQQKRQAAKLRYAVLKPDQFDDHDVIDILETVPAFNRHPGFQDLLKRTEEAQSKSETQTPASSQPESSRKISFGGME